MDFGFDFWVQFGLSAALLLAAIVALLVKKRRAKENIRWRGEVEAAESIRLMALALQAQGKLDAAWAKFQESPATDSLLDDFLKLAADYDQAGQPKRAMTVLQVVQERRPGF